MNSPNLSGLYNMISLSEFPLEIWRIKKIKIIMIIKDSTSSVFLSLSPLCTRQQRFAHSLVQLSSLALATQLLKRILRLEMYLTSKSFIINLLVLNLLLLNRVKLIRVTCWEISTGAVGYKQGEFRNQDLHTGQSVNYLA